MARQIISKFVDLVTARDIKSKYKGKLCEKVYRNCDASQCGVPLFDASGSCLRREPAIS